MLSADNHNNIYKYLSIKKLIDNGRCKDLDNTGYN